MVTISKKMRKGTKGKPPSMDDAPDNLKIPQSNGDAPIIKTVPIQFKITEQEYNQFCQLTGMVIGYKKGDKSKMFSKMLEKHARSLT